MDKVLITKAHLELFEEMNIFFSQGDKPRILVGDVLNISSKCVIEPYVSYLKGGNLFKIGTGSYSWSPLSVLSTVGRFSSIARGVGILGVGHPLDRFTSSSMTYDMKLKMFTRMANDYHIESSFISPNTGFKTPKVSIGNDCWIGANAIFSRGVVVGDGAVVAANSLVTRNVPPYAIVGGNPAQIIRFRFPEEEIKELRALAYWEYDVPDFLYQEKISSDINILEFINKFKKRISLGDLQRSAPESLTYQQIIERS